MHVAKLPSVLSYVWSHPLSSGRRFDRLLRFAAWQISARLAPGPVAAPYVDSTRLLVSVGIRGTTGNGYAGLNEFLEMAFTPHRHDGPIRTLELQLECGVAANPVCVRHADRLQSRTWAAPRCRVLDRGV